MSRSSKRRSKRTTAEVSRDIATEVSTHGVAVSGSARNRVLDRSSIPTTTRTESGEAIALYKAVGEFPMIAQVLIRLRTIGRQTRGPLTSGVAGERPSTIREQVETTAVGTTMVTAGGEDQSMAHMAQWLNGRDKSDRRESFIFRAKARTSILSLHKESASSCTYTADWIGS